MHGVVSMVVLGVVSAGLASAPTCSPPDGRDSKKAITASTVAAPARSCAAEPTTAAGWQRLWDSQQGPWSGGDGVSSTRLPDGRLLWLFGDTLVGGVDVAGRREPGTRLVRNSIVVTEGGCVDVVPTPGDALPGREGSWLWPTHSVIVASSPTTTELAVFAQRMTRTGDGAWGFDRVGTVIVRVSVPRGAMPVVGALKDLPASAVLWGAATLADGATTWIYGTRASSRPMVFGRDLLLARAPTWSVGDVRTWSYRTATGWTRDSDRAAVVRSARDGVSTVPSVARLGSTYVVVTKPDEFLGDEVTALTSLHPWGPWADHVLFSAPSTSMEPRYSPCLVASLGGRAAIVAVSRTSTALELLARDAWRARPTFTDVLLPG